MIFKTITFKKFFGTKFIFSRFLFSVFFLLIFGLMASGFSDLNFPMFLLIFSGFLILTFQLLFVLTVRSDDFNYYDKWTNISTRIDLLKEKTLLTNVLTLFVLFFNIIFFIVLKILPLKLKIIPLAHSVSLIVDVIIFIFILSYLFVANAFCYWFLEIIEIKSYSTEIKVLKTSFKSFTPLLFLFAVTMIYSFSNILINEYYRNGTYITSENEVIIFLILELIFTLTIYLLFLRKKKINFTQGKTSVI